MKVWEIGKSIGNRVAEGVGRVAGRVQESRPLSADLLEDEDAYLVVFDAPGVESGDVQVRFADGDVLVRMERFRGFYEGFEMRFPGRGLSLDGRVRLPDDSVDPEGATATLKDNGTLHVHIPKDPDARATTVEIERTETETGIGTESDVDVDTDGIDVGEEDGPGDEGNGLGDEDGDAFDPDEGDPAGSA
jgi:HSP20 family molecular chaperone IbpA